ncbi:MAG: divalent-cation tolerance protein CutA [Minwuiales bacterium]|nr:divalent-cation tolerance protein CutA [Minwuiales bacterium]
MSAHFVYVTAGSEEEARRIAAAAVQERLAACANMFTGMRSIYRWEGKVAEDDEIVLILKTRAAQLNPLMERIRSLHSYDCPCIVAWPISAGNPAFLHWIEQETAESGPRPIEV